MNGWGAVTLMALFAMPPIPGGNFSSSLQPAEATGYNQPVTTEADSWSTYKQRLGQIARLRGVRGPTVDENVPGLTLNRTVIEFERTEPLARSSGGVVGAL